MNVTARVCVRAYALERCSEGRRLAVELAQSHALVELAR
jgi:hypothetical protein